jgi:dihydropteroate synthase
MRSCDFDLFTFSLSTHFHFMYWQTSRRQIPLDRPLVMGILNVTPDSFSDGGKFASVDAALRQADLMIADGVDIIDIGGESTRPGSRIVDAGVEAERVVPVIRAIVARHDIPISIDTSKSEVAKRAVDAGAEVINDISGLRWDEKIGTAAAESGAALVLMHSRGTFETIHTQPPVDDIMSEVAKGLRLAVDAAKGHGVADDRIALDIGIGFGKTLDQNLELLAKLDKLVGEFQNFPILVGTSRKSFIGKIIGDGPPAERQAGSLASAVLAAESGAMIIRAHDVRQTVEAVKVTAAILGRR